MKLRLETFVVLVAVGACAIWAKSQATDSSPSKTPELKLTIIPSKETYTLNEEVFTKAELTNLTDKTLCFPEPALECEVTDSGSIVTTGEPVAEGDERDFFLCHAHGRGVPRDELSREIQEKWVRVAPGAVHTSKSVKSPVVLNSLGQWRLTAAYRPPQAAFGNVKEFKTFLQATASSAGCVVPERYVAAESVIVNVVPPADAK